MPKSTKLNVVQFRIDTKTLKALKAHAEKRGEPIAEVCRRLIQNGLDQQNAEDSIDYVSKVIRDSLRDVLKPVEERMAKLNAKAAVNTGTIQYMTQQLLEDAGHDSHDLYSKARKKAVALLRAQEGDDL